MSLESILNLPQLAMLQTLADYIKMHMPELVTMQAQQPKLTWKKVENNGYNSNHFAIHMKAVHDSYVEVLSGFIQGNNNDKDKDKNCYGNTERKPFNASKMANPMTTQESKVKEWTSIHTKVRWNGQPNTFEAFKSAIESWAIQNSLDYIVDPDFISTYVDHAQSWKSTKKELDFLKDISLKQFIDQKVLYGAIKSGTWISSPNNKYIVDHACHKDGVITWYKFLQDYNGEDKIQAKMTNFMLKVERDFDPRQKGGCPNTSITLNLPGLKCSTSARRMSSMTNPRSHNGKIEGKWVQTNCHTGWRLQGWPHLGRLCKET